MDTTKSKAVLDGFAKIVKVPQSRFYTAIDLKDGTTKSEGVDETAGGFAKATTAKDINFMIIQKSAVIQYPKHTVNKVVTPDEIRRMTAGCSSSVLMVWLMCTKTRRQVFICTTRHRRCLYGKDSRIDF